MSRRRAAEVREIREDARYGSKIFAKFINGLMWEGKKSVAESIFYKALDILGKTEDPVEVVTQALANVRPSLEVRSRRVGGATYAIPMPLAENRARFLSIRWIIHAARARSEKTMVERLSAELRNAADDTGAAVKKRIETHRSADANKAFAHYRW